MNALGSSIFTFWKWCNKCPISLLPNSNASRILSLTPASNFSFISSCACLTLQNKYLLANLVRNRQSSSFEKIMKLQKKGILICGLPFNSIVKTLSVINFFNAFVNCLMFFLLLKSNSFIIPNCRPINIFENWFTICEYSSCVLQLWWPSRDDIRDAIRPFPPPSGLVITGAHCVLTPGFWIIKAMYCSIQYQLSPSSHL